MGWAAIFIFIPIAFNPLSRWQYEPDKAALLVGLTGVLLGWTIARSKRPLRHGTMPERWISLFLFVYLLSMAISVMPHWSLWGDPAWRNGLLVFVTAVVLFFIAQQQFSSIQLQDYALNTVLMGSGIVALYGLLEKLGYTPFSTDEDAVRVASTLAHPNLLAGYLAMTIPLNVGQIFVHWAKRKQLFIYLSLFIIQTACLVFTLSRAGWLSTMIGIGTFIMIWLWITKRQHLASLMLASMVIGFVSLFVMSVLPPLSGDAPHSLQTLTTIFRWKGATAQIRLIGWEASLDAIAQRPFLGYGAGTFRIVLDWFSPPELAPFGGTAALGGRPHNMMLRVAIESGLIGLGVFVGMLVAIILPIIRAIRIDNRHQQLIHIAILSALIANLVNNLFSFESTVNLMLFWALAGIAHAPLTSKKEGLSQIYFYRVYIGRVVAFSSVILMVWLIIPDMFAYQGETGCPQRSSCDSISMMQKAVRWSPTPEVFSSIMGKIYAQDAIKDQDQGLFLEGAAIYDELVNDFPQVTEYWRLRGLYYRRWYLLGRDSLVGLEALQSYSQAIELSSTNPDLWLDRGLTYLDLTDYQAAVEDFNSAERLIDDYARYYGAMSIYSGVQGDVEAAVFWQQRQTEAQDAWNEWSWRR